MKTMLNLFIASILTISVGNLIAAPSNNYNASLEKDKALKTIAKATAAFEDVMDDPKTCIPQTLIDKSEGIVILPGTLKLAVGTIGGQGGRGIAMIRKEDGSWSNPFFITLGEGSLGIQIGAQSTDMVLLFKHRIDVLEIDEAEIMLGGDVEVAAGPESDGSHSNTDIRFEREIYSYYRSRGLFAGASLNGGVLSYNESVNDAYYGMAFTDNHEILDMVDTPFSAEVSDLIETINIYGK